MKFYLCRVDGRRRLLTRQDEAKAADPSFEKFDIPVDQEGLKAFVESLSDQIDEAPAQDLVANSEPERESSPSYSDITVKLEEVWENLPLAMKLHFAALAVEDAREIIRDK